MTQRYLAGKGTHQSKLPEHEHGLVFLGGLSNYVDPSNIEKHLLISSSNTSPLAECKETIFLFIFLFSVPNHKIFAYPLLAANDVFEIFQIAVQ